MLSNHNNLNKVGKANKKYKTYNNYIVNHLCDKHNVSKAFVRMSINGDRTSEKATEIKKTYQQIQRSLKLKLQ